MLLFIFAVLGQQASAIQCYSCRQVLDWRGWLSIGNSWSSCFNQTNDYSEDCGDGGYCEVVMTARMTNLTVSGMF